MNILVVGKMYAEGFAKHISQTLTDMGHTVKTYEPGLKASQAKSKVHYRLLQAKNMLSSIYMETPAGRLNEEARMLKAIAGNQIELLICCHDFLSPRLLKQIKNVHKCTTALWFPDAISNFGKAMFMDAAYDFLFFKEPFVIDILRNEYAKNAFYLPECCNPRFHNRVALSDAEEKKYKCEITTAGNMHTSRSSLFKLLQNHDVKIWGNPSPIWMDTEGIEKMIQNHYVSNVEKSKAFLAADIVLNTIHPTEIDGVNVRSFEIPACGGFQLSNNRKALKDLFIEGEEIVTFSNIPDLNLKLQHLLANPVERQRIAANGYRRVHSEHTYQHRLQLLLDTISGTKQGFKSPYHD